MSAWNPKKELASFKCHECGKKTFLPMFMDWGWKCNDRKFCTYTCMRKYTNRNKITLICK